MRLVKELHVHIILSSHCNIISQVLNSIKHETKMGQENILYTCSNYKVEQDVA